MSPNGALRTELLVRRLILLAGDLRDQLASGDWEAADPIHAEYDESFAMFRHLVDGGATLAPKVLIDVERLAQVHAENERLTAELQDLAGRERNQARRFRTGMRGYAPLTKNEPGIEARFVDGSA